MALTLRLSLGRVNAVIVATAVLHNICRLQQLADNTIEEEIPSEVEIPPVDAVPQLPNTEQMTDSQRGVLITDYFDK